jgi:hypothetical protein
VSDERLRARIEAVDEDEEGGGAREVEGRDRLTRLSTALAQLESAPDGTALVPVESVAPMVSAILEAFRDGDVHEPGGSLVEHHRHEVRVEAIDEARSRYRLSRVGSGSVAGVVTGLWLLPQLVAAFGGDAVGAVLGASLLAPLFAHALFDPIAFGVALYGWFFFGLTWLMEQNDRRRIDWVTTDAARGALLKKAVLSARQRGEQDSISKSDLREALGRGLKPSFPLRLVGARDVSASFLDRVTTYHLSELQAQGVLAPSTQASLSPRYLVAEEVSRDLMP